MDKREIRDILREYGICAFSEWSVIDSTNGGDYRRICRISMYPNVMSFIEYLKRDKEKMMKILKKILTDPME